MKNPRSVPRVSFQGELGAFSEEGVRQLWDARAEPVPRREFMDVVRAVESGGTEYGLLPIENTLAGSVIGSYDALAVCERVHVVGETIVPIHHCLLAPPGAALDGLACVYSHPVALAQCARFFEQYPHLEARAAYDTAGAARDVAKRGDATAAAIAAHAAAERYGLDILAADIEDRADNQTRFLAIARAPSTLEPGTPARTALLLTTGNVPGALLRVLQPLAEHGINLSKLESRPTGEPWSYRFFVEMEHSAGDADAAAAIESIRCATQSLRVLGSYARWSDGRMRRHLEHRIAG
jgi:prephenate dehydratase